MKTLLFINACIRGGQSRTWRIAAPLIEKLRTRYHVETIDICALDWTAVGPDAFRDRGEGIFRHDVLNYARMTAAADRIVIAAPFWDMSFPAALKVFFEQISLPGYTFDDGRPGASDGAGVKKSYTSRRGAWISGPGILWNRRYPI